MIQISGIRHIQVETVLVAKRNRNTTKPNSTIPKSGYGFLEALLSTLKGHSAALAAELEKNHKKRGRKGYPALGKALRFNPAVPVQRTV